jgi:hypothetical protein
VGSTTGANESACVQATAGGSAVAVLLGARRDLPKATSRPREIQTPLAGGLRAVRALEFEALHREPKMRTTSWLTLGVAWLTVHRSD